MAIVPKEWMPNCSMKRIITHWTAGGHKASSVDLSHYHILIEDDGNLIRGTDSIKDNVSTDDGEYAAHTARLNTGSIGVTVCCMLDAIESPFKAGRFSMTKKQWETMVQVVAELCQFYDIEVTSKTVLGHGEVEKTLGVKQHGKWDPMALPWDTKLSKSQVGNQFRDMVKARITGSSDMKESPANITAIVQKKSFREAQVFNEKSYIKLRPLLDTFDWAILHAVVDGTVEIQFSPANEPKSIQFILIDHANEFQEILPGTPEAKIVDLIQKFGFVKATELATAMNLNIIWDGLTRTVILS